MSRRIVILFQSIVCCSSFLFGHFLFPQEAPRRRVLLIMTQLKLGGAEQAFISLVNGWSIPHTKVEIFLKARGGILDHRLRKDFPIISAKQAMRHVYDAAVCFGEWMNPQHSLRPIHAKRKAQWIHTDLTGFSHHLPFTRKETCDGVDAFVCVSEKAAENARHIQPQLSEKIFAVQSVVDGDLIKRKAASRGPLLAQNGLCNVVSVGRLSDEKGFDRAIRVHSRLEREGIHFRWYVIGDGYARTNLEKQIRECGLQGKFILVGQKMNPFPYVLQADVFAMPSRIEGWCLAVTEAKILGKPILFTDVAGAREQIETEKNGLVVANTEEGIYEGIKRLVQDRELRLHFSKGLENFKYDNASIYKKIENILF